MGSFDALLRLNELVPPPDSPVRAFGDWKRFTSVNGFAPPDDYRMLVREYGVTTLARWADLIEPFNPGYSYMDRAEKVCHDLRSRAGGAVLWPAGGGFLPWATTAAGDHVGWRPQGRPARWTTMLWPRNGNGPADYPFGAVELVLGLVEGTLPSQ